MAVDLPYYYLMDGRRTVAGPFRSHGRAIAAHAIYLEENDREEERYDHIRGYSTCSGVESREGKEDNPVAEQRRDDYREKIKESIPNPFEEESSLPQLSTESDE